MIQPHLHQDMDGMPVESEALLVGNTYCFWPLPDQEAVGRPQLVPDDRVRIPLGHQLMLRWPKLWRGFNLTWEIRHVPQGILDSDASVPEPNIKDSHMLPADNPGIKRPDTDAGMCASLRPQNARGSCSHNLNEPYTCNMYCKVVCSMSCMRLARPQKRR